MAGTKYFRYAFAVSGDLVAIPDPTQVSGSVSYQQGWTFAYERDLLTDPLAIPIPRDQTNQLMNDITTAIQQYQQVGVPNFILASQNGGVPFPYAKNSYAIYSGIIYQSLINGNTDTPPSANWLTIDPLASKIPSGTLFDYAGSSVPSGFLLADGSAVSRTTYANLFAAIGVTWGPGDGTTTFNLPDSRRRVCVGSGGSGSGTGVVGITVGNTGGQEDASLPSHAHTNTAGISGTPTIQVGSIAGGGADSVLQASDVVGTNNVSLSGVGINVTINANGVSPAGLNFQPSMVVTRIIKT